MTRRVHGHGKKRALTRTGVSFYRGQNGWRWRWIGAAYQILAESPEAYPNKTSAQRGWDAFLSDIQEQRVALILIPTCSPKPK